MDNKENKPIYKKWWFWLILVIIVVGFVSQGESLKSNNVSVDNEQKQTENIEKFTLVESQGSQETYSYYINGTIKNNTDKQYSYVQVTFNLYDSDGAQIGTALANINNLEPDGTWKFKAVGLYENIASYKLAEITGW